MRRKAAVVQAGGQSVRELSSIVRKRPPSWRGYKLKAIISDDRVLVYKIECARFSYHLAERAWGRLTGSIDAISKREDLTDEIGLDLFSNAWSFVDFAVRQFNVLTTIPGIDRRDVRYRAFEAKKRHLSSV